MATKKKAAPLKECPYGARCYRKNPDHFAEFSHPKKAKGDDSDDNDSTDSPAPKAAPKAAAASKTTATAKIDDTGLPPCKYGASCYRKNLMHFAEFSHPTAVTDKVVASDDSGNDTDVISDEDVSIECRSCDNLTKKLEHVSLSVFDENLGDQGFTKCLSELSNREDPDQTASSEVLRLLQKQSDLGLHCLSRYFGLLCSKF